MIRLNLKSAHLYDLHTTPPNLKNAHLDDPHNIMNKNLSDMKRYLNVKEKDKPNFMTRPNVNSMTYIMNTLYLKDHLDKGFMLS